MNSIFKRVDCGQIYYTSKNNFKYLNASRVSLHLTSRLGFQETHCMLSEILFKYTLLSMFLAKNNTYI